MTKLFINRRKGESISILTPAGEVTITVIAPASIRLKVSAPEEIKITRSEPDLHVNPSDLVPGGDDAWKAEACIVRDPSELKPPTMH